MDSWTRTYLGSLFVVLALISVSPAQDDADLNVPAPPQTDLDLTDVIVDVEASDRGADVERTALPNEVVRMVRLKDDGILQGRVQILYPTGKTVPAAAELAFKRAGETIEATETNDEGMFEIAGLDPGRYTATASIEAGSTDFTVNVLPYDAHANPDQMMLDATLTPTPEIVANEALTSTCDICGRPIDGVVAGGAGAICDVCGEEIIVEEYIEPYPAAACCGGGFSGGGGCCGGGGGRGLGWLLGAGGLAAGITALAIDDDDGRKKIIASPHRPH